MRMEQKYKNDLLLTQSKEEDGELSTANLQNWFQKDQFNLQRINNFKQRQITNISLLNNSQENLNKVISDVNTSRMLLDTSVTNFDLGGRISRVN